MATTTRCTLHFPEAASPESREALGTARAHGAALQSGVIVQKGMRNTCPGPLTQLLAALLHLAAAEAKKRGGAPRARAAEAQLRTCKRGRTFDVAVVRSEDTQAALEAWGGLRLRFQDETRAAASARSGAPQWRFRARNGELFLETPDRWLNLCSAHKLRLDALPPPAEGEESDVLLSQERALAVLREYSVTADPLQHATPASIAESLPPLKFPCLQRTDQLRLRSSGIHRMLKSRFTMVVGAKSSGKTTGILLLLREAMKYESHLRKPHDVTFRGILFDTNRGFIGGAGAERAAMLGATILTPGGSQRVEFLGTQCTLDLPGFCSALEELYSDEGIMRGGGPLLVLEMLAVYLDVVKRYLEEEERLLAEQTRRYGSGHWAAWEDFQARVLHPDHSSSPGALHAALRAYVGETHPSAVEWLVPGEEKCALLVRRSGEPCLFKSMVHQVCIVPLREIKFEAAKIRVVRVLWFFLFAHLRNDREEKSRCTVAAMPDAGSLASCAGGTGQTLLSSALHPPVEKLAADVRQLNSLVFFDHPAGGQASATKRSDEDWTRRVCADIFGLHGGKHAAKLTDVNFLRADRTAQPRYRFGWGSESKLAAPLEPLELPRLEEKYKMGDVVENNFGAPGCLALSAARAAPPPARGLADVEYTPASALLFAAEKGEMRLEADAAARICKLLWDAPAARLEYVWAHGCAFVRTQRQLQDAVAPLGLQSGLLGVLRTYSDGDAQLLSAKLSLPPPLLAQLSPGCLLLPEDLRDLPWSEEAILHHTREPSSIRGEDLGACLLLRWDWRDAEPCDQATPRWWPAAAGSWELDARSPRVRVAASCCVQSFVVESFLRTGAGRKRGRPAGCQDQDEEERHTPRGAVRYLPTVDGPRVRTPAGRFRLAQGVHEGQRYSKVTLVQTAPSGGATVRFDDGAGSLVQLAPAQARALLRDEARPCPEKKRKEACPPLQKTTATMVSSTSSLSSRSDEEEEEAEGGAAPLFSSPPRPPRAGLREQLQQPYATSARASSGSDRERERT